MSFRIQIYKDGKELTFGKSWIDPLGVIIESNHCAPFSHCPSSLTEAIVLRKDKLGFSQESEAFFVGDTAYLHYSYSNNGAIVKKYEKIWEEKT